MDWTQIIIAIIGTGVVSTGLNALINRRERSSKTDGIDINNLVAIIEEERKEIENKNKEFEEYKRSVDERIIMFKGEFAQLKEDNQRFLTAILQAYRCPLPQSLEDCPVLRAHKDAAICQECNHKSA